MATKTSVASGFWDVGTTWNGGTVPTIDDDVTISGGYTVTVRFEGNTTANRCQSLCVSGATLAFSYNTLFYFKDAAAPSINKYLHFRVTNTALTAIVQNTAFNGWSAIMSGTTYPVRYGVSWPSSGLPSLPSFRYLTLGGGCYLGHICEYDSVGFDAIWFNDKTDTTYGTWLTSITPIERDTKLVTHFIEHRTPGERVYKEGVHAGVIRAQGFTPYASHVYEHLEAMHESDDRYTFISPNAVFRSCRIENVRFTPRPGSLYIPFEFSLIEDE